MNRQLLEHREWALSNGYKYSINAWPRSKNHALNAQAQALHSHLISIENYYQNQHHIVIDARDVTVLRWTWPSGDERWEIIGTNGSVLCDHVFRIYYPPVVGKCFITGFDNERQTVDFDISGVPEISPLTEPHAFVGGAENYGHWVDHYLPIAILLKQYGLPCYLRRLNQDQRNLLELAGIFRHVEAPSHPTAFQQRVSRLVISSKPPPSNVANILQTIGAQFESVKPTLKLHLVRTRGNTRTANLAEVQQSLNRLGFISIPVDRLPIEDNLKLLKQAHLVVCEGGASLVNLLFIPSVKNLLIVDKHWITEESFTYAIGLAPLMMGLSEVNFIPCDRSPISDGGGISDRVDVSILALEQAIELICP
jgi:hypothetical protein